VGRGILQRREVRYYVSFRLLSVMLWIISVLIIRQGRQGLGFRWWGLWVELDED